MLVERVLLAFTCTVVAMSAFAAEVPVELGRVAVQLGLELRVGAFGEQLDGGQQVTGAAGDGGPRLDLLAETAGFAGDLLRGPAVVPEAGR